MLIRLAKRYISTSWVDPRIEICNSSIQGKGMFAHEPISRGETVVIWGGQVFSEAEVKAGKTRDQSAVPIDDHLYLGSRYDEPGSIDEYMNHSCNSNVWLEDEVTLIARWDIAKGEELTIDYALWEANPSWQMQCCCTSPLCRQVITGNDWKLSELQTRYQGHFSPYITARIRKLIFK